MRETVACAGAPSAGDITDRADIEALLRRFYGRVLVDDVLAAPFTKVREVTGLESHIPVMADFWETMLFHVGRYRGRVQDVHKAVAGDTPLGTRHFLRWLTTWYDTVDRMYAGRYADLAKQQAARMAWSMHRAITGADSPQFNDVVRRCTDLVVSARRAGAARRGGASSRSACDR